MKNFVRATAVAFSFCAAVASMPAYAGAFRVNYYGDATAKDIASVVTDAFTKKFPASKYEIFLLASAGQDNEGDDYCYAQTGVIPAGSNETPQMRYSFVGIKHHGQVMTVGLRHEFEAECARGAVRNMMSDQLSNIYLPYKK
jgi:hypothetical protein